MAKDFLTIDQVMASAASIVKWNSSEDRANMRHWIWIGELELGFSNLFNAEIRLNVQDLCAEKPDSYKSLKDFALYNSQGEEIRARYRGFKGKVHKHNYDDDDSVIRAEESASRVDVSEDDSFFYLGSNGSDVECMVVRFWQIPIDKDQNPLIPEDHRLALMLFVKWMKSMQDNSNQSEIDRSNRDWKLEAKKVRGNNKMPNMKEAALIAKEWMSMLPPPIEKDSF